MGAICGKQGAGGFVSVAWSLQASSVYPCILNDFDENTTKLCHDRRMIVKRIYVDMPFAT